MKTNRQKSNWILDTLLFTGFLVSFALDLTGLPMHQWVGVFGGLLAVYHLVIHWDWVTAVTLRFFGKTSGQARTYYLLDALILLGFYLILVTGLVISTWMNLPLTNYAAVKDLHVITSIVILCLVVLKIGLHGRWIVRVARQHIFRPALEPVLAIKPVPATVAAPGAMTRADFLKLMGIVSAASLVAVAFTLNDNQTAHASGVNISTSSASNTITTLNNVVATQDVSPTATSLPTAIETTAVTVPTATSQSVTSVQSYTTQSTTTCVVRCNKHCSFPGHCRKYQDTNGNNLCDLGECM
jgi:hypothetical protein